MSDRKENQVWMHADVVIVGTGAAGLYCALQLPKHLKIIMITKDKIENSDSYLAQGGISVLKDKNDYELYFEDTMKAGRYENNREAVEVMIRNSTCIIEKLINYGVDFDRTKEGFSYTREGAHSTFRILHHKDVTGREIVIKLLSRINQRENIKIFEYMNMLEIIEENHVCKGILAEDKKNKDSLCMILGKKVLWATGGIGGLFESSTNFSHLTADSLAISLSHGIEIQDINYIQIHPTTLYSKKPGRRFLISESVRGEGAYLLNERKERFVNELLPRDVVTAAICDEMSRSHTEYVYLSVTHLGSAMVKERFPNIYEKCLEEGYDLTKEDIPVTPAQHYFMGGVKVDLNSLTSMENLYAIGETSCNGVHGANRLASNSLLEGLVFAGRAASHIAGSLAEEHEDKEELRKLPYKMPPVKNSKEREKINKHLVLEEIKRKDEKFYAKWCNHAS